MKRIRFNPYTCQQYYLNVTMKQPHGTDLWQFPYRTTVQRKYTASLRLTLIPHIRSGSCKHNQYSHFRVAYIHSSTHIYITVTFLWRTYTLMTDCLYVNSYNITSKLRIITMFVTVEFQTIRSVDMFMMCLQPNITCVTPVVH